MSNLKEKYAAFMTAMDTYTREDCVVAFSGGVDSSLILKAACQAAAKQGTTVYAVTVHTKLHPVNDLKIAETVAREMGAVHHVIHVDELAEADILDNPPDRCYRCKKTLFAKVLEQAAAWNAPFVIEGTNEDDLHVYRPGIKALAELGVESPLARHGLTKQEIRELAAELGISVSDRPSNPCLATRFPYGTRISYPVLERVDRAEEAIRALGFYNVRVRIHGEIARIEVDDRDLARLIEQRNTVIQQVREQGFDYVTLDLEGFRSGSMDIHVEAVSHQG